MSAYQPAAQPRSTSQQWQSQPPHLQQAQLAYQLHLQHQQLYQRQQEQQWQQSRQAEEDQRQQEAQRQEEEKRKEEARRQAEAKRQEEERKEMERYQYLDQYLDQYNRQYAAHSSQQVPSTTNGITPLQYPPKPPDDISAFSLRGASATDARTRTAAVQPSYQMPAMSSFNPAADSYAAYRAQASAQFGPYEATQPASNLPAPSDTGRPSGSNASTSTAPQVPGQPHASESNRTTNSSNRPKPRAAVPRASQQQHHGASSRQQHNAGNVPSPFRRSPVGSPPTSEHPAGLPPASFLLQPSSNSSAPPEVVTVSPALLTKPASKPPAPQPAAKKNKPSNSKPAHPKAPAGKSAPKPTKARLSTGQKASTPKKATSKPPAKPVQAKQKPASVLQPPKPASQPLSVPATQPSQAHSTAPQAKQSAKPASKQQIKPNPPPKAPPPKAPPSKAPPPKRPDQPAKPVGTLQLPSGQPNSGVPTPLLLNFTPAPPPSKSPASNPVSVPAEQSTPVHSVPPREHLFPDPPPPLPPSSPDPLNLFSPPSPLPVPHRAPSPAPRLFLDTGGQELRPSAPRPVPLPTMPRRPSAKAAPTSKRQKIQHSAAHGPEYTDMATDAMNAFARARASIQGRTSAFASPAAPHVNALTLGSPGAHRATGSSGPPKRRKSLDQSAAYPTPLFPATRQPRPGHKPIQKIKLKVPARSQPSSQGSRHSGAGLQPRSFSASAALGRPQQRPGSSQQPIDLDSDFSDPPTPKHLSSSLPNQRTGPTFQLVPSRQRSTLGSDLTMVDNGSSSEYDGSDDRSANSKPRRSSMAKLPAKRLAELLESIFEAEDEIPATDDLERGVDGSSWHNDYFEVLDPSLAALRVGALVQVAHLLQGSSKTFDDFVLGEVLKKKDLETVHPPSRQLYEVDHNHLARLIRILEQTASASDGVSPFKSLEGARVLSTKRRVSSATPFEGTDSSAEQYEFMDASNILVRGALAGQCIFALMCGPDPPKTLLSEDAVQAGLTAVKSCIDGVLVPFADAASETSTEGNSGITRFFGNIGRILPAARKASKKDRNSLTGKEPEAMRAWDCIMTLVKAFESCKAALSTFQRLCSSGNFALSETIVISVFYLTLKPLFMAEPDGRTASSSSASRLTSLWHAVDDAAGSGQVHALAKLREPCLSLVRFLFAKFPNQRAWIFEEVLSNLINLPDMRAKRKTFRLSNGTAVHPINALLVQIIQSADMPIESTKSAPGDASIHASSDHAPLPIDMDESSSQLSDLLDDIADGLGSSGKHPPSEGTGLEGAIAASGIVTTFLINKLVDQPKVSKSAHEFGYVSIIETLVADLQTMLFLSDWPAVAVLLTRMAAGFLKLLDSGTNVDVRGTAVEHLGSVAALLRSAELDLAMAKLPHTRFNASWTVDSVSTVVEGYALTLHYLQGSFQSKGDAQNLDSVVHFWRARALAELGHMHKVLEESSLDLDATGDPKALEAAIEQGKERISSNSRSEGPTPMSTSPSTGESSKLSGKTVKMLTVTSPTFVTFEAIKTGLLRAMDDKGIPTRQRALRMINVINNVDSTLLDDSHVRSAVEVRTVDGSPAVRELAVKLLGDYLASAPQHIPQYFESILSRLADSAISVRKRAVKIIIGFYATSNDTSIRVKLCLRIVRAIAYDTTGMQPLALDAMGEMWFGMAPTAERGSASLADVTRMPMVHTSPTKAGADTSNAPTPPAEGSSPQPPAPSSDKLTDSALVKHAPIIVAVARQLRERPSPLEEAFKAYNRRATQSTRARLNAKFRGLAEELIDGLASIKSDAEADAGDSLKAIHAIVAAHPGALSVAKAKDLLPYLTYAKSPDELMRMEMALRILAISIPHLSRSNIQFNEHLQKLLTGLVNRPPPISPASPVMQELIACFCASSIHLSHDYKILVRTLVACVNRMKDVVAKMTAPRQVDASAPSKDEQLGVADRPNALVVAMSSLLCEHADFDQLRKDQPDLVPLFDKIGGSSVLSTVYGLLLRLYQSPLPVWQLAALQNMGLLLRSYAPLWTQSQTERVMDRIFDSDNIRQKEYLVRIMAEYLGKEHRRQADLNDEQKGVDSTVDAQGKVDMAQLVGNTETFAESSISTQLVQRYLDPVLEAAVVVSSPLIQRFAMDILDHTVKRGLSHPLHCVMTLIAVETSPDRRLADKALELHTLLASKHGSILAVRYVENARAAMDYQRHLQPNYGYLRGHKVASTGGGGFVGDGDVTALLAPWYGLLGDKRQRLDFVRSLVKVMDCDTTAEADPVTCNDILFARFVADNLAVFAYRSMDEVLTVLHELKTIVSTTGMQALHLARREVLAGVEFAMPPAKPRRSEGSREQVRYALPRENFQFVDPLPAQAMTRQFASPTKRISLNYPSGKGPEHAGTPTPGATDTAAHTQASSASELEGYARMSQLVGLALTLRNHIKWLYNLSEAKCVEPKAAAANKGKSGLTTHDKVPTERMLADRTMAAFSYDSIRHITFETLTPDQSREALECYQSLVAQEGTEIEPEDPLDSDDMTPPPVGPDTPAERQGSTSMTPMMDESLTLVTPQLAQEELPSLPPVPSGPFNLTRCAGVNSF